MKKLASVALGLLLVLDVSLYANGAAAQQSAVEQAKVSFGAGAQAYAAGRYDAAVSAFEDAYHLAPRPQILFSLAQAERKRYFAEGKKSPEILLRAIAHYEAYVKEVQSGARVPDAVDALSELGPIAAKLDPGVTAAPQTPAPPSTAARLTIYSSVEGAKVRIDNGAPVDAPFIGEVAPGRHHVLVTADGYADATREVSGEPGVRTTLDIPLEEKPAELIVDAARGCEVYVDGRAAGIAPNARPLSIPSGPHIIACIANGRRVSTTDVVLERGKRKVVTMELERSGQRVVAGSLLITGGAALVAGTAFAFVSLAEEGQAKQTRDAAGNITAPQLSDYNSAIGLRDTWRTASIATLASGVALLGTGALLYAFDKPELTQLPPMREKPAGPKKLEVDLAAAPILTKDLRGLTLLGHF